MTEPPAVATEVVLALRRGARGRIVVDVRTTRPELAYGSVELVELPLLLEALVADVAGPAPDVR